MKSTLIPFIAVLSLGMGACTKAVEPPPLSEAIATHASASTTTTDSNLSAAALNSAPKVEFNESRNLYIRIVQKRRTYTFTQNDVPEHSDENEFKKEANLLHKTLKDFIKDTSMIVEKYASTPYMNKSDREQVIKHSKDSEQTGTAIVSILKDVYGPQSPKIDFTKLDESLCKYSPSDWEAFFTELKDALKRHKKAVRSDKDDKRYMNALLDHEIWRVVKKASDSDSIEFKGLQYLKQEQCNLPRVATVKTETKSESNTETNESRNETNTNIVDDPSLAPQNGQPLGVRYYSPEQLEQLPPVDTNAPNVGTIDPNMELNYTH